MSLSTWFKEYLYIPLGGNRKRKIFYLFEFIYCIFCYRFMAWSKF
ncbi:hypothetical protein OFR29_04345 [Brachyspira hyodysenteriae]|nr:hypothetical protein [Brachyspira hyodysenteriae]MCZ9989085.1 hypothetical protein [Brachyspira hyodysenteriae]MCZ9997447.1 hypothetical protein [Brachyspira hyodysenteriae]MDA0005895.1 hypothetical protein [Brachyspira hyodysenteriae]MDA0028720.1 hypothetical protein [Brachyspira hyodysenteriae]